MARAVCPGSFDPPTRGHLDVVARAAALFDHVVVAVLVNKSKKSLFSVDERMEMLSEITAEHPNVSVGSFHGLLVDYCQEHGIRAIVKGLRAVTDFDYELQMAQMNSRLAGIETVFVPTGVMSRTCCPSWCIAGCWTGSRNGPDQTPAVTRMAT